MTMYKKKVQDYGKWASGKKNCQPLTDPNRLHRGRTIDTTYPLREKGGV